MSTRTETKSALPPGIERGKKYRFVVKSAEEAVHTLRERLGEEARVISVRQIDGQGLSKFLNSPKLEIVAMVPEFDEQPEAQEAPEAAAPETEPAVQTPPTRKAPAANPETSSQDSEVEDALREAMDQPAAPQRHKPEAPEAPRQRERQDIWSLLERAGFSEFLLTALRYGGKDGRKLEDLPLPLALAEVQGRLRDQMEAVERRPVTSRIAFLGTPGVGKTTALCKRLANEVFLKQRRVEVLKLDADTPNPDDALAVFCDVLGTPLHRDPIVPEMLGDCDVVYLDAPGVGLQDGNNWQRLGKRLDDLGVDTRVLVVNAAYEAELLQEAFEMGQGVGATHVAFTHLDELSHVTKLWRFVLRGGLSPFFISHGQNVTSDYTEDFEEYLSQLTFPRRLMG